MYVHMKNGIVDEVINCSKEFLETYYGADFVSSCVFVSYKVEVGYVWDEYFERFVPESAKTLPADIVAENKLLKAQLQAQSDRSDFIEDCIAEMAIQVYGGV